MRLISIHLWPDCEKEHRLDDDCDCEPFSFPTANGFILVHGAFKTTLSTDDNGALFVDGKAMALLGGTVKRRVFEPPVL